ncbi:MAG: putative Fe-S cluster assembly protein SufT [Oligoflexia bacterium]|nr:putative Fe-S cluster assembly protein SufT [Oligoflexia bacterium]
MVGLERRQAVLSRDVKAIQIPSGEPMTVLKGIEVTITQTLGGNYTVITDQGFMVRISGRDADSLGETPAKAPEIKSEDLNLANIEKLVWEQLQSCFDPEIPVSIVELGLIYKMEVKELKEKEFKVDIEMTLTAPGCGMGQVLHNDVEEKVKSIPGVKEVNVQIVLDPPWDRSMMTEAAKLQLGMF